MLESLIGWLINRHLKTLLAEYTSGAHDLTFTDGRLQLNDLSLRTDVVAGLDLPLVVVSAHVKQLELMLPWSTDDGTTAAPDGATVVSDGHRAVVVRCDGVTLVLQPHTEAAHVPGGQVAQEERAAPPSCMWGQRGPSDCADSMYMTGCAHGVRRTGGKAAQGVRAMLRRVRRRVRRATPHAPQGCQTNACQPSLGPGARFFG